MRKTRGPGISVPGSQQIQGPEGPESPGWVYYNRLLGDQAYSVYRAGLSIVSHYTNNKNFEKELQSSIKELERMAANERRKEINILNKKFNNNIPEKVDLDNVEESKNLVKSINYAFQIKSILDRAIKRNEGQQQHISIAPFLYDYYITSIVECLQTDKGHNLKNYLGIMVKEEILEGKMSKSDLTNYIIDNQKLIEEIFLEKIENSKVFNSKGNSIKNPYFELIEFLQNNPDAYDTFFSAFYDIYGDAEYFAYGMQSDHLQKRKDIKNDPDGKKWKLNIAPSKIRAQMSFSKGGKMAEQLKAQEINYITQAVGGKATQTGGQLIKADIIITFGGSEMYKEVEKLTEDNMEFLEAGDSLRVKNVEKAKALSEKLKSFSEDDFLVYVNAKNYSRFTLENGQYGSVTLPGFSTGSNITLQTYSEILKLGDNRNHVQDSQFITTIMNTIKGAIADRGSNTEKLERILAKDIAIFLFDDIDTIGNEFTTGADTIHLFLLDDFYVPLSELLLCVARAMKGVLKDPASVFTTNLYNDFEILYQNGGEQSTDILNPTWTMEDWRKQRQDALSRIKIEVRFLRNFLSMIQDYLK